MTLTEGAPCQGACHGIVAPARLRGKFLCRAEPLAGQALGWEQVECVQYGEEVTKTIKTFLATYRPAGGIIRVVLVKEGDDWIPFFCTDPKASVVDILEAASD